MQNGKLKKNSKSTNESRDAEKEKSEKRKGPTRVFCVRIFIIATKSHIVVRTPALSVRDKFKYKFSQFFSAFSLPCACLKLDARGIGTTHTHTQHTMERKRKLLVFCIVQGSTMATETETQNGLRRHYSNKITPL